MVIGILVLAVLGVGIWLILQQLQKDDAAALPTREPISGGFVLTEDNIDEVEAQKEALQKYSSYTTEMNMVWTFENAYSPSLDYHVVNSLANEVSVYFVVTLEDTGEVIYKSIILPPGARHTGMALDRELDPGSYNAVCTYVLVDEEGNDVTEVSVAVQIIILE